MTEQNSSPTIIRHLPSGQVCCDPQWEAAYKRFETPEQEIDKFIRRLRRFGIPQLSKQSSVIELFCGRGGGLVALERLGFTELQGVDLSDTLLEEYRGPATLHLADCRQMPMPDHSFDVVIVQGGLHHLPTLPDDLELVLAEVKRILTVDGIFYVVEPWLTPFLRFVHLVVEQPLMRKIYAKGDALAAMTDCERETYEQWLHQPQQLLGCFDKHFETVQQKTAWGKLLFAGRARQGNKKS